MKKRQDQFHVEDWLPAHPLCFVSLQNNMKTSPKSIALKAYLCTDGRNIHYSVVRLHKDPVSPTCVSFVDVNKDSASDCACWIFFYPAGPNRRILEFVAARYAPHFDCDRDVMILCVNRPGKGTSSSNTSPQDSTTSECEHINTACRDVTTILDYYEVSRASLMYMCAGSTFAYSFASKFSERTTGYIIGVSSWVLRNSHPKSSSMCSTSTACVNDGGHTNEPTISTPHMHTFIHNMAMSGWFGSRGFVSSLVGGISGTANGLLNIVPETWIVSRLKKSLSDVERVEFEQQFPDRDGVGFAESMKWMNEDGCDGCGSEFVNLVCEKTGVTSRVDGVAKDIAVCLGSQEDLGMRYAIDVPAQKEVLLWHGTNDKMISISGSEYLASMIPNSTLTEVELGTHHGTMFFFPKGVIKALNKISGEV